MIYHSKLFKKNKDVVSFYVFHNFNNALSSCSFPTETDKENYRAISILPNLSKDQIFSKLQCGFRKAFSAEQCLIYMIEKWRTYLDTGGHGSALFTDLSKAFDCIDRLLIVSITNC